MCTCLYVYVSGLDTSIWSNVCVVVYGVCFSVCIHVCMFVYAYACLDMAIDPWKYTYIHLRWLYVWGMNPSFGEVWYGN